MIVMERIIVDGNYLYHGHRLAWRLGIVLNHTPSGLVGIRLERRSRERKRPETLMAPGWLLKRTPDVEAKLAAHGVLDGRDDAEETPTATGAPQA
jgi:hypothetical protein